MKTKYMPVEKGSSLSRRKKTLYYIIFAVILLATIFVCGNLINEESIPVNFTETNQRPSLSHIFGTDWAGRDMFVRTIKGLSLSILIGFTASVSSAIMALIIGTMAAIYGRKVDAVMNWLIDITMGMPHLIFLILISFVFGKGAKGIIIGIILTHWTSLARVVRAEVLQIKSSQYVKAAKSFGISKWKIAKEHILPHVLPQFLVGLVLMFPHAILHEASITFLGFGLSPHQPGIGVILDESLQYLSTGQWWIALMPGLSLLLIVRLFDILGENLENILNPHKAHE